VQLVAVHEPGTVRVRVELRDVDRRKIVEGARVFGRDVGAREDARGVRVSLGQEVELRDRDDALIRRGDVLLDLPSEPAQDRHHAHQHRHADRDAEHEEPRAQLVRADHVEGEARGFLEGHGSATHA
jgi:hypothetical protein